MNEATRYLIFCADKGDFQEFLKTSSGKKVTYRGKDGFDIYIHDGKIVKVRHYGKPLMLVELDS